METLRIRPLEVAALVARSSGRTVALMIGNTGSCLAVHDLAVSTLAAGRPKDLAYVEALCRHGLADPDEVVRRVDAVRSDVVGADVMRTRARAAASRARSAAGADDRRAGT